MLKKASAGQQSRDDSPWKLECFGQFRVVRGDKVIERFRTQKTASLLALLALQGGQSRETVCALLWPEAVFEAARGSLSTALSSLRREMGDEVLNADRHSVSLIPGTVTTDVAEFDTALKGSNFARVIEIYRGPLLPGIQEEPFPTLAGEYEEKARGAFAARIAELEEQLGHETATASELLHLARRACVLFGDDERWFLAQMRAQRILGDYDAALRLYESLQRFARKQGLLVAESTRRFAKTLRRERERGVDLSPPRESGEAANENQIAQTIAPFPLPNLPSQWTRFFGRDAERALLGEWLASGEKLVTISGSGGAGKTRLVIEVIGEMAATWTGRVGFVPLASLSDASLLLSTIRDAMSLVVAPDLPPLEQLQSALHDQRCLLVLDNFEQLIEGGVVALQQLREKLPDATFLVTSRAVLRLPGEREFPLSPLPTPLQGSSPAEIGLTPSIALFCDRASIEVDDSNAEAIAALCRRLDGIPLALELAAARGKMLAPQQILERLERHPDFLQSRELGVPSRQKTLRSTIEWSLGLLAPEVRSFFVRLCVFRGGWTLEAAEHICAPGVCASWETVDFLEVLRDHSLLFPQETETRTRYRLLEMLREWGESELGDNEFRAVQERHYAYYLALAESTLDPMVLMARLSELDNEVPNFRSALTWALNQEDANLSAKLAGSLGGGFWEIRALGTEGREWAERALAKVNAAPVPLERSVRARLLLCCGAMNWLCGSYTRARSVLEEGVRLFQVIGDERGAAAALNYLAKVAGGMGEAEKSREDGFKVVALARKNGDYGRLVSALITTAWACLNAGYQDETLACLEECSELGEGMGILPVVAMCRATKPFALLLSGRPQDAVRASLYSLEALDERCGLWATAIVRGSAGMIALATGDIERARQLLPSVTLHFHAISTRWEVASMLSQCAGLAVALGDFERAALIYGATEALRERCGHVMLAYLRPSYEASVSQLDKALDPQHKHNLWARGRTLSLDEAVALTQALA